MEYKEEQWKADYKQAAKIQADLGHGCCDGIVGVMANIIYIRRGLIADGLDKDKVKASLDQLYKSTLPKSVKLGGFLSNCSAAAAFCDLKNKAADITSAELPDDEPIIPQAPQAPEPPKAPEQKPEPKKK